MPSIELSAGTIDYEDSGGHDPVVVLVHGLLMDGSVWRHVVHDMAQDHRCIVPTLPLGAHVRPMRTDADMSLRGIAGLLGEFLRRLDLQDITLVVNDWGGALLTALEHQQRIRRLVLTSCEAFDNIPPGLPGLIATVAGRLPGGIFCAAQVLRATSLRRLPMTFGWMTKRHIPDAVFQRWLKPCCTQAAIRHDLRKYISSATNREDLLAATVAMADFKPATLIAWAAEDRVMPPEHGQRLAELIPHASLIEISDSYTLIPEDQPARLAQLIREFSQTDWIWGAA